MWTFPVFLQRVFALEPLPTTLSLTDEPGVSSARLLVLVITTHTQKIQTQSLKYTGTDGSPCIHIMLMCMFVSSYVSLPGL